MEALGLPSGPAGPGKDEDAEVAADPSASSALDRSRSIHRNRAKLIVDGAYLEASIKVAGEGRKGRLDHLVLLSLLEDRLDMMFEKKVLYQATPDGQPNHFHRSISHPDGAHVKVCLQPLKARVVTMDIGGGLKQNQEIYLDKGVDLALALEILEPFEGGTPSPASSSSSLSSAATTTSSSQPALVVVTGDGDLAPVIERAERAGYLVVVCGGRKTLSEKLHQHVRKGSGQAVWLDDLIEQSWVLAPHPGLLMMGGGSGLSGTTTPPSSGSSAAAAAASLTPLGFGGPAASGGGGSGGSLSASTSSGSMAGSSTSRPPLASSPGGMSAAELSLALLKQQQQQQQQQAAHFHHAHHLGGAGAGGMHGMGGMMGGPGAAAAAAAAAVAGGLHGHGGHHVGSHGGSSMMMPPLGLSPKQKLYRCPQGRFCDKLDEPGHLRALRHPCPKGATCLVALSTCTPGVANVPGVSELERREHMLTFVHICPKGTSCPRNDIEHCTHFDHPYRRTKARCPDGGNCPYISRGAGASNSSAREHSRLYRHPCPKGSTCPLLAGKQPSEKKRYHLMDYTHPCHVGCKYSVDKEWAWQHFSDFDHIEDAQQLLDSRSNTTTEDEESVSDHVILEGGWNYLDEAGGGGPGGAGSSNTWVPSPSSSAAGGGGGGLEGPLGASLFSSDFFKPFNPAGGASSSSGASPSAGASVGSLGSMDSMAAALHNVATTSPRHHHGGYGGGHMHASPHRSSTHHQGGHHGYAHQQQQQHYHHPSAAGSGASPLRDFVHHPHSSSSSSSSSHRQQQQYPYMQGGAGYRQEKGPQSPWRPSG